MLVADYDSSGSDTDSSNKSDSETVQSNVHESRTRAQSSLPSASFLLSTGPSSGVFSNPFREAEDAKKATLEKHVKMVSSDDNLLMKNGKRICWNYRKGRCRFGSNCTFAHDSDLHNAPETESTLPPNDSSSQNKADTSSSLPLKSLPPDKTPGATPTPIQTQTQTHTQGKLKRPGLSATLTPSKKVMKMYNANRGRPN